MSSRNNADVVQREHNLGAASMCGWLSIIGSDCGESGIAQDAITANDAVIIPAATPVQHRFNAQDATTLQDTHVAVRNIFLQPDFFQLYIKYILYIVPAAVTTLSDIDFQ